MPSTTPNESRGARREAPITIDLDRDERRIYDRLRSSVLSQREPGDASGLGDLLFLLPDLTVLLSRLMRDDHVPLTSKALALAGVAYVLSPLDFMPAILIGPIGLVDDLVVVAATLSGILNKVHPDVVRSHWSGQGDALEAIHRVTEWTASQLTGTFNAVVARLIRR